MKVIVYVNLKVWQFLHNINEKVTESKWYISYVNVMQTNSNI